MCAYMEAHVPGLRLSLWFAGGIDRTPGEPTRGEERHDVRSHVIAAVRLGDLRALETLYRTLYPRLLRIARRYAPVTVSAEDLVHDAFLALWDHRTTLDLREDVALYLITTIRHRAFNIVRHDQYVRRVEESATDATVLPGMGEGATDADAAVGAQELHDTLRNAVDALPEMQRRVMTLRWRSSLSYDAIALELGMTTKMVRLQLARAYRALRPHLRHLVRDE
jgi:RNA polymerase sigma factor (sigma-70 family)